MIITLAPQFHFYLLWGQRLFSIVSQQCPKYESTSRRYQPGEGPIVGAFSVIVKTDCETDRTSAALVWKQGQWTRAKLAHNLQS